MKPICTVQGSILNTIKYLQIFEHETETIKKKISKNMQILIERYKLEFKKKNEVFEKKFR